ncbi:sigma factor-like helix-turn-helix DNA-binding protein [Phaeobacter inhibens]|uniref:sigma factor-like helix-turn-helix DNA-binding protein n=1 Tax=Phaeobacter inhibens TaxID=221822 RepID=UPI0021A588A1|nr:sigma factor-like helix-turn-helix DNA-binding protein [Phaeobacter inhibens]
MVPVEEATELAASGVSGADVAETTLTARQVQSRIADLDPALAQPLLLVCAEGYSYREVSELLDVPIGTVMSRIHRARKLLISSLSPQEVAEL